MYDTLSQAYLIFILQPKLLFHEYTLISLIILLIHCNSLLFHVLEHLLHCLYYSARLVVIAILSSSFPIRLLINLLFVLELTIFYLFESLYHCKNSQTSNHKNKYPLLPDNFNIRTPNVHLNTLLLSNSTINTK